MSQLLSRLRKGSETEKDTDDVQDGDDISIDDELLSARDEDIFSKKKKDKNLEGKKKRGWVGILIIGLVAVALAGFAVAVVQFNVFGLRDNQLREVLEAIPIVNNLLPPLEAVDPVLAMSVDELLLEISRLESHNESLSSEVTRLENLNRTFLEEISVLQAFEAAQAEFSAARAVFERESALGNPAAFENFFRQISPETAEEIFREVAAINHHDAEMRAFISTYNNMDESAVADIFEQLIRTDSELLMTILRGMNAQRRADILSNMTVRSAEQLTRWMAPVAPDIP